MITFKVEQWLTGAWESGNGSHCLMSRVSVWGDEKVLEMMVGMLTQQCTYT